MPSLLAVNVGNTMVNVGVFEGDRLVRTARIPAAQAADLRRAWPADLPPLDRLADVPVVACSVNPPVAERVEGALSSVGARVRLVGRDFEAPMPTRVREPKRLGADRLVNAYEGYARYRRAMVIVDLGTAITVDAVSGEGVFLGGAILAGWRLAALALNEHTALLPAVTVEDVPAALGDDTVSAIRSGLFWGAVGAVRELVARLRSEVGADALVLATGGDAARFGPHIPEVAQVVPELTLLGLHRVFCDVQRG
jgi:type III pantothenate kinase